MRRQPGQRYLSCRVEMAARFGANLLRFEDNTADCSAKTKNEHSAKYEQLVLRISLASVSNEWAQRVADIVMDDKVRMLVVLGHLVIDNHQSGARTLGHQRKTCRRPHHQ